VYWNVNIAGVVWVGHDCDGALIMPPPTMPDRDRDRARRPAAVRHERRTLAVPALTVVDASGGVQNRKMSSLLAVGSLAEGSTPA
jgi:hypothetical protein